MDELDVYYRAFKDFRKETENNRDAKKKRNEYISLGKEFNKLKITKYKCLIDTDWISVIEEELKYVEKAVREERQFIRTNGEVVPIEKAKRVSKDSVEHLAKHSSLITHIPENNEAIIPDQIYTVERLSDYSVYENRFLYMLLCYLRDFINLRLEKIRRLKSTYIEELRIKKDFKDLNEYSFELSFNDKRFDNKFPIIDEENENSLRRIEECQSIILMLLSTDLMIQVSKAQMVKPPIIKTNVLKMNNNFKHSLALYNYIVEYNKDGFEAQEVVTDLAPFNELIDDELSEIIALTNNLGFKYGNNLYEYLENRYIIEGKRRKDLENQRLKEQIERLKRRLQEDKTSIDEYIILLEKRNKMLELDSEELKFARNEIIELNNKIDELNQEKSNLKLNILELDNKIKEKIQEINDLNQAFIIKLKEIDKKHLEDLENERIKVSNEYEIKLDEKNNEMNELIKNHEIKSNEYLDKINNLNLTINDLNKNKELLIKDYELKIKDLTNKYNDEINDLNNNTSNLCEKINSLNAQINALRTQNGLLKPNEELTAEERFKELEEQYKFFNEFFKQQWKLTKKEIRKNILWNKK